MVEKQEHLRPDSWRADESVCKVSVKLWKFPSDLQQIKRFNIYKLLSPTSTVWSTTTEIHKVHCGSCGR